MYVFETVTVLATLGALAVGALDYLRSGGPLTELGRQGMLWFERPEDRAIDQRPSEDALDAPLPRRPLRGRIG